MKMHFVTNAETVCVLLTRLDLLLVSCFMCSSAALRSTNNDDAAAAAADGDDDNIITRSLAIAKRPCHCCIILK